MHEGRLPIGGITTLAEEMELEALNDWIEARGIARGQVSFDFADAKTRDQKAVFDMAWPNGLQAGLSEPAAVLIDELAEALSIASSAGFCFFMSSAELRTYVRDTFFDPSALPN